MKNEEKEEKFNFLDEEEFAENTKKEEKEEKKVEPEETLDTEEKKEEKKEDSKNTKDKKGKAASEELEESTVDFDYSNVEELEENHKEESTPSINNNINNGFYISYELRVALMVLFSILFLALASGLIIDAVTYSESETVNYNESSSTDYKVCLEENSDYSESCLGQNMQYLSLITKNIPVTFDYNVKLSSPIDYNLDYYVVGSLKIVDRDNNEKVLYTSEDVLVPNTNISNQNDTIKFTSNVDVDFKYYNNYVTGYKSRYSLNSDAYLDVILYLNENTGPRRISSVTIPLGEQTYGISKSQTLNNNKNVVVEEKGWSLRNYVCCVLGIVSAIIGLGVLIKLIRLLLKVSNSKSKYQRKLKQLLREYDRVIVVARNGYEVDTNKKLIKVLSFTELLDARDALEKPIVYVKVNEVKSEFYVEDVDKVYQYVMKDADF